MPAKRRILTADLDDSCSAVVQECFPSDQFEITPFREDEERPAPGRVDLVIFRSANDKEQTEKTCAALRAHVGQSAPMILCTGKYVYTLVKPLLGNCVQSIIIMPFDVRELRQNLDQLDLGF